MSNFEDFDDGFVPGSGNAKANPVPRPVKPVRQPSAAASATSSAAMMSPAEALAMAPPDGFEPMFAPPPGSAGAPRVTHQSRQPMAQAHPGFAAQTAPAYQPAMAHAAPRMPAQAAAPSYNPLAAYYRAPGITVSLPTNGQYQPEGAIAFDMAGEVQVYPVTAADEILLKNPDALMSGYAVEQMLRSCVPGITDPRRISSPDLDVLLLAVRAASYGNTMEVEVTCPECQKEGSFDIDIRAVLATAQTLPPEAPVRLSPDVVAYLRPFNLENATRVALATFHEARNLQALLGADEATRTAKMNESYERLMEISRYIAADCVMQVAVPEGIVTDPGHIREFMANVPASWTKLIEAKLKELNEMGLDRTVNGTCSACNHAFTTELQFDPASFFG